MMSPILVAPCGIKIVFPLAMYRRKSSRGMRKLLMQAQHNAMGKSHAFKLLPETHLCFLNTDPLTNRTSCSAASTCTIRTTAARSNFTKRTKTLHHKGKIHRVDPKFASRPSSSH
jgi:hypothetical protein